MFLGIYYLSILVKHRYYTAWIIVVYVVIYLGGCQTLFWLGMYYVGGWYQLSTNLLLPKNNISIFTEQNNTLSKRQSV